MTERIGICMEHQVGFSICGCGVATKKPATETETQKKPVQKKKRPAKN